MRRRLAGLLLLTVLTATACGDDGGTFGVSTTATGGETSSSTTAGATTTAAETTTSAVETTTTVAQTTTTTAAATTTTAAAVVLGPACENTWFGYTIAYPEGWHVAYEGLDVEDTGCRLFGPDPFADPDWEASRQQAHITISAGADRYFGAVDFSAIPDAAEWVAAIADELGLVVTPIDGAIAPMWSVDGWVPFQEGSAWVYGYVIEPWEGSPPVVVGTASPDQSFVEGLKPTVDSMAASFVPPEF